MDTARCVLSPGISVPAALLFSVPPGPTLLLQRSRTPASACSETSHSAVESSARRPTVGNPRTLCHPYRGSAASPRASLHVPFPATTPDSNKAAQGTRPCSCRLSNRQLRRATVARTRRSILLSLPCSAFHLIRPNAWGQSRRAAASTAPQCYTLSSYSTATPAPTRTAKRKTKATQIQIGPNILVFCL